MPHFGHESDQNAIMKRLRIFKTAALPRKDGSVTGKIIVSSWIFNRTLLKYYAWNKNNFLLLLIYL